MWEYVIGGATIFGSIVGLFSWYNGRITRKFLEKIIVEEGKMTRELFEKVIVEEERLTREMISDSTRRTQELLEKLSEQHTTMIEQHTTMIEILKASLK